MKQTLPIILILASIGIFVFFINGENQKIKATQIERDGYQSALGKSMLLLKKRDDLKEKYNRFDEKDLVKLTKMLPDHVDNVQLILDINGIARKHENMSISRVQITQDQPNNSNAPIGPNSSPYASVLVSFRTTASYNSFVSFIKDLEQNLRLVDITSLAFKSDVKDKSEYAVTIRTYWLK